MMEYVHKEIEKRLPKASLIAVRWRWWWFKRIGAGYRFFSTMRVANSLTIWIGPMDITVRRRWLIGPARQLHPEAFSEAMQQEGQS